MRRAKRRAKRFVNMVCIIISANSILLFENMHFPGFVEWMPGIGIFILFSFVFWLPFYQKKLPAKLQIMMGGYELALSVIGAVVAQLVLLILTFAVVKQQLVLSIANLISSAVILWILWMNAILRIILTSKQTKIFDKAAVLFLWWMLGLNFYWTYRLLHSTRTEFFIETSRLELDSVRAENKICCTKYPIVMVHGVFFRDWQLFQYWGRIPQALMKNGAQIYYGHQQSAAPVRESAMELKNQILKIIEEQHCEKVNIIAHSKGGLDTRYAISCLGLAPYVASLTTINTPHRGCRWAEMVLEKVSDNLLQYVARKYDKLFTILGDKKPDFVSAVKDLTSTSCAQINEEAKDVPSVFYQSTMSVMKRNRSDGFPLNIMHFFIKRIEGENDGLVSADSAKWGHFSGITVPIGVRGISHGDMIDLRRENIRGFDVLEFYVKLVMELKRNGF